MKRGLFVGLGIVGLFVVILLLVFGSYIGAKNQMVQKDEAVKSQYSEIDTQLQRRADLVPNLVATVKGFATHEETVFGDIANARAGLLNARDPQSKFEANGKLDSAFGRLLALSENYPELKSNQNFLALQDQLEGSENRISVARTRYNRAVQDYNTFIRQFPNSIWAGIAGFQPNNAYFQASEASKTAPVVKF
jgi:LemA protein